MRLLNALTLALMFALPNAGAAQRRDSAAVKPKPALDVPAVTPACCTVVRIEPARSLVTARETATGFTFRFELKNRRVLGALKIGQAVWADFAAKTVKLKATDASACCAIVEAPPTPGIDSLGSSPPSPTRYGIAAHTWEVK